LKKGKTECVLFGTSQRIKNKSIEINYRRHPLSQTNSYKYLGVQHDQTAIETTYRKASGRLYLLKRVQPQLTIDAALTIYKNLQNYADFVIYVQKPFNRR